MKCDRGRSFGLAVVLLAVAIGSASARAADEAKPDGNWRFVLAFPDFGVGEFNLDCRLTMKQDGEKLTGQVGSAEGEGIVPILEGTFKEKEIAFRVVDPQGFVSRYKGKLDGDKITGKFELDVEELPQPVVLDWKATREKVEETKDGDDK